MWGCPFVACLGLIHLIWGHLLVWMPRASFFSVYWFLSPWWECTYAGAYCPILRFAVVAQGHPWGRRWERMWLVTILESVQAAVGACDCSWVLGGRWWGLATILDVWNGSGGGWRALEAHAAGTLFILGYLLHDYHSTICSSLHSVIVLREFSRTDPLLRPRLSTLWLKYRLNSYQFSHDSKVV